MPNPCKDLALKKARGVYYTPAYVVDYIVEHTVGRLCAGSNPAQVSRWRILDPACGTGCFLLGAFQYLLNWHRDWYLKVGPRKHLAKTRRGQDGQWHLTQAEKKRILLNNIYGVDIDRQAVDTARRDLWSLVLHSNSPAGRRNSRHPAELHRSIRCGNSLLDLGLRESTGKHGGFHVVLGNPPYGAALEPQQRAELARLFTAGTTDTAALFMVLAHRLTRAGGWTGLIVPKPFTYSTSWKCLRHLLLDELTTLVDAGKVWPEVKLEQVIYFLEKGQPSKAYRSFRRNDREFICQADIPKNACREFGFLINGLDAAELALGRKLRLPGHFLADFTQNTRGAGLQRSLGHRRSELRVIGGKQIQRYLLAGNKGRLDRGLPIPPQAFVRPGSILVQNIVAHIGKPSAHLKIIGAVVGDPEAAEIVILDTVNQLTNRSHFSSHYLLGLLHSRLINWYVYKFIFAQAIRTLHFDGPVSRRIPLPVLDLHNALDRSRHDRLAALAKVMADLHRQQATAASASWGQRLQIRLAATAQRMDQLVYGLYGLTNEETVLVEKRFG
jgi:hypothetical protein